MDPAYEIFARAEAYWSTQSYPPYANYLVTVTVTEKGDTHSETYRSAFNAVQNSVWVDPISDYELAHPAQGRGLRFCLLSCPGGTQPAPRTDFFGVPQLSPIYSFGIGTFVPMSPPQPPTPEEIIAEIRREFHDPDPRLKMSPAPRLPEMESWKSSLSLRMSVTI